MYVNCVKLMNRYVVITTRIYIFTVCVYKVLTLREKMRECDREKSDKFFM